MCQPASIPGAARRGRRLGGEPHRWGSTPDRRSDRRGVSGTSAQVGISKVLRQIDERVLCWRRRESRPRTGDACWARPLVRWCACEDARSAIAAALAAGDSERGAPDVLLSAVRAGVARVGGADAAAAGAGRRPAGAAAGLGWLTGTVGGLGVSGYWMARAGADYFGLSPLAAAAFTVAVDQLFVAPFFALFGLLVAVIGRRRWRAGAHPGRVRRQRAGARHAGRQRLGAARPFAARAGAAADRRRSPVSTGSRFCSRSARVAVGGAARPRSARGRSVISARRAPPRPGGTASSPWPWCSATAAGGSSIAARDARVLRALLVQGDVVERGARATRRDARRGGAALRRPLTHRPRRRRRWCSGPRTRSRSFPRPTRRCSRRCAICSRAAVGAVLSGAPRAGERAGRAAIYNSAYLFTADGQHAGVRQAPSAALRRAPAAAPGRRPVLCRRHVATPGADRCRRAPAS